MRRRQVTIQSLTAIIGSECVEHAHVNCHLTLCGCSCHLRCERCGQSCEGGYDSSQEIGIRHVVCATCYPIAVHGARRHHCEMCGADDAYHVKLNFYLCISCYGAADRRALTMMPE